jgi:hypothetical protein
MVFMIIYKGTHSEPYIKNRNMINFVLFVYFVDIRYA